MTKFNSFHFKTFVLVTILNNYFQFTVTKPNPKSTSIWSKLQTPLPQLKAQTLGSESYSKSTSKDNKKGHSQSTSASSKLQMPLPQLKTQTLGSESSSKSASKDNKKGHSSKTTKKQSGKTYYKLASNLLVLKHYILNFCFLNSFGKIFC